MSLLDSPDWFSLLKGDRYIAVREIRWRIGFEGNDHEVVIPPGFAFDSSVPRLLTWIVSRHHPAWLLAACIHDYLLSIGYPQASAAAEWHIAATAVAASIKKRTGKADAKAWLIKPAFLGVCLFTVPAKLPD